MRAITCPVLQYPGLEIRLAQRKVLRNGEEVSLTRNEYGVLTYLTTYPGQVFSKQQILKLPEAWKEAEQICEGVIL